MLVEQKEEIILLCRKIEDYKNLVLEKNKELDKFKNKKNNRKMYRNYNDKAVDEKNN